MMNLALFKIVTMSGASYEIEAMSRCQAITIWSETKPKDEFFKTCLMIKSSKDIDRYIELKADFDNLTREQKKELEYLVDNFKQTEQYKKHKKYNSFKNI